MHLVVNAAVAQVCCRKSHVFILLSGNVHYVYAYYNQLNYDARRVLRWSQSRFKYRYYKTLAKPFRLLYDFFKTRGFISNLRKWHIAAWHYLLKEEIFEIAPRAHTESICLCGHVSLSSQNIAFEGSHTLSKIVLTMQFTNVSSVP